MRREERQNQKRSGHIRKKKETKGGRKGREKGGRSDEKTWEERKILTINKQNRIEEE